MRIAVWRTGHEIADTVAEAVVASLPNAEDFHTRDALTDQIIADHDIHIGYGILRRMDAVFRACDRLGKPWLCVDRGYFLPNHFTGYYRVSLRGTQQTVGLDKLEPDYDRWDELGIEILSKPNNQRKKVLVCPPTDYVSSFFNLSKAYTIACRPDEAAVWRDKTSVVPLDTDLLGTGRVITFNSSVGWEALRQGIPVISDSSHSIVGSFQKMLDRSIHSDYVERRRLFAIQAGLQLRLDEMKSGQLWPLMNRLLYT